ncbi:MAG: hypothetical protein LBR97_00780 [Dysgonamonadaceae bacterium]|jgi:hypothetical protein|nr:hypothetical protein [Dysgonamonadaceae bacterium]
MKTMKLFSLFLLLTSATVFYSCDNSSKSSINISETTGLLDEENAWDKYMKSLVVSTEKRNSMQIDKIDNDDLKDSFKYGGKVAPGKEIYTGDEGRIETFLVIIPDHLLYEYLISYNADGDYVDCIEAGRIGQDETNVTIEGNTVLCETEWWDSGEGGKVSRQYTITPELKFNKEKEWEEILSESVDREMIVNKNTKNGSQWTEILLAILLFIFLAVGLTQMVKEKDNDRRKFVGSYGRIFLFGLLMFSGIFFIDGVWDKIIQFFGAVLTIAFSYFAYLKPADKILRDGPPSKNIMQILGGMWSNLENKRGNKEYIGLREERINQLNNDMNKFSEADQSAARNEINSLNRDINNEKYKTDDTIALIIISVFVGVLFIWITPFVAIIQYVRNYPLYLRKKEKNNKMQ